MQTIGSLLSDALGRNRIRRQVSASLVVEQANRWLGRLAPPQTDIEAVSFANRALTIRASNPKMVLWMRDRSDELRAYIRNTYPDTVIAFVYCQLGQRLDDPL